MKPKAPGLVCAGGVPRRSFVTRLSTVRDSIGPLKASSYPVARRIVNSLRIGRAVESYSAFEHCEAIWIVAPESALDRILAGIPPGAPTIVCDTFRDSSRVPLTRAATLHATPDEQTLVAEGHADVIRYLRRVAAANRRKLIEIPPVAKAPFLAGVNLATHIALPWIAAAIESLRSAGFSRTEATRLVRELGERTLRSYTKAGAKAWTPAAKIELRRDLQVSLPDPRFADLYRAGIEHALQFFRD